MEGLPASRILGFEEKSLRVVGFGNWSVNLGNGLKIGKGDVGFL